ncbi:MAG: hypothetical protein GY847_12770 [Proteobacteria bacterium]|nr:hypothetical protein [Pseudomonadota bacterium]
MTRPGVWAASLFLSALTLTAGVETNSSTLVAMPLKELTLTAGRIFVGKVLDSTYHADKGRIFTVHRVQVQKPISTALVKKDDVIEVVTAGGRSDQIVQIFPGEAELKAGDEYLFFLALRNGRLRPVGLCQGVYSLIRDPNSGMRLVQPTLVSARLVKPTVRTTGKMIDTQAWLRKPKPLEEIIKEIENVLKDAK